MTSATVGTVTEPLTPDEIAALRRPEAFASWTEKGLRVHVVPRLLATIAAKQEALRIGQQTIEKLLAERDARDAEIARLRNEAADGWKNADANGRECQKVEAEAERDFAEATRRAESAERERDTAKTRVAQLEAALRQTALDIGNAAALMMLANMPEECAVMRKCEEAARAALETR